MKDFFMCQAHADDRLQQLHHDFKRQLERSGELILSHQETGAHHVTRADVYLHGLLKLATPFFPPDWTANRIVQSFHEVLDAMLDQKLVPFPITHDLFLIRNRDQSGILITCIINSEGELIMIAPQIEL